MLFVSYRVFTYIDFTKVQIVDLISRFFQIDDLTQKLNEAESKCSKFAESCRDKDLKLDLLQCEVTFWHLFGNFILTYYFPYFFEKLLRVLKCYQHNKLLKVKYLSRCPVLG